MNADLQEEKLKGGRTMSMEMQGAMGLDGSDEFDLLLNDVLQSMANPETPEPVRVMVHTRVWVRETDRKPTLHIQNAGHAASSKSTGGLVVSGAVFQDFQARMNPPRDAKSTWMAVLAHVAAIALIFWGVSAKVHFSAPVRSELTQLAPPPIAPMKDKTMGGGGGQRGPTPVTKGALPKFAETQITPPMTPPIQEPKIRMPAPTIEVQTDLKMANNNMPNLGMPSSPLNGVSMGDGRGSGLGAGTGSGLGPGSAGNYGGGVKQIGGGVSAPTLIFSPDPEFSEEARKAKFMGIVTVNLIVDEKGMPQNVRVTHGVGMGLDQKAVEAVKQYKFKPAMEHGKPVAVMMNVEVNFQIF
jgi:protein TonB